MHESDAAHERHGPDGHAPADDGAHARLHGTDDGAGRHAPLRRYEAGLWPGPGRGAEARRTWSFRQGRRAGSLTPPRHRQGEAGLPRSDELEALMRKMTILGPAIAGASSIFLASPLWAQGTAWNGGYPCGPHMAGWHGGWGGMVLGPLLMILVPVLLIVAVLLAARRFWPSSTGPSSAQPTVPQAPLDILQEIGRAHV